jgi:hypothetical protein
MGKHGEHLIRPMPADFPEIGPTLTLADACRHWKAGAAAVHRWHRENGTKIAPYHRRHARPRPSEPAPPEFVELAPTMCAGELKRHYMRGARVIRRWLEETGATPKPFDRHEQMLQVHRERRKSQPFIRQPPPKRRIWNYTGPKAKPLPGRDWSIHGQAADHLRRYAAVYRCGEQGAANPNGDHYRFGNIVLTPDELLQRAQAKGWEARF